jgi:hypothetical protein
MLGIAFVVGEIVGRGEVLPILIKADTPFLPDAVPINPGLAALGLVGNG